MLRRAEEMAGLQLRLTLRCLTTGHHIQLGADLRRIRWFLASL